MKYTLENGKTINIPDKDIEKMQKNLDLSENEAIELWLTDKGYLDDEEQDELDNKAKKVKIKREAKSKDRKKSTKPKTVKVYPEKQQLFNEIYDFLTTKYGENVKIINQNKIIHVQMPNDLIKLDFIRDTGKKKK